MPPGTNSNLFIRSRAGSISREARFFQVFDRLHLNERFIPNEHSATEQAFHRPDASVQFDEQALFGNL